MLIALLSLAMDVQRARIPVHFEPNLGQVAGETEWVVKARGGTVFITGPAIAFALATGEPDCKLKLSFELRSTRWEMERSRRPKSGFAPFRNHG